MGFRVTLFLSLAITAAAATARIGLISEPSPTWLFLLGAIFLNLGNRSRYQVREAKRPPTSGREMDSPTGSDSSIEVPLASDSKINHAAQVA